MNLDNLIKEFIHIFYGYGNLDSDFWFVGMEEGGGNSFEEIQKRVLTWNDRARPITEDLVEYHKLIDMDFFFEGKVKIQSTWGKLIRCQMAVDVNSINTDDVRLFQKNNWGRKGSNNCLLELLPLPSPSANKWFYKDFSQIPYLNSRENYKMYVLPFRVKKLRELIDIKKPKVVLFYGLNKEYINYWKLIIAPINLMQGSDDKFYHAVVGDTNVIVCLHPVAFGAGNEYFEDIGKYLRCR